MFYAGANSNAAPFSAGMGADPLRGKGTNPLNVRGVISITGQPDMQEYDDRVAAAADTSLPKMGVLGRGDKVSENMDIRMNGILCISPHHKPSIPGRREPTGKLEAHSLAVPQITGWQSFNGMPTHKKILNPVTRKYEYVQMSQDEFDLLWRPVAVAGKHWNFAAAGKGQRNDGMAFWVRGQQSINNTGIMQFRPAEIIHVEAPSVIEEERNKFYMNRQKMGAINAEHPLGYHEAITRPYDHVNDTERALSKGIAKAREAIAASASVTVLATKLTSRTPHSRPDFDRLLTCGFTQIARDFNAFVAFLAFVSVDASIPYVPRVELGNASDLSQRLGLVPPGAAFVSNATQLALIDFLYESHLQHARKAGLTVGTAAASAERSGAMAALPPQVKQAIASDAAYHNKALHDAHAITASRNIAQCTGYFAPGDHIDAVQ